MTQPQNLILKILLLTISLTVISTSIVYFQPSMPPLPPFPNIKNHGISPYFGRNVYSHTNSLSFITYSTQNSETNKTSNANFVNFGLRNNFVDVTNLTPVIGFSGFGSFNDQSTPNYISDFNESNYPIINNTNNRNTSCNCYGFFGINSRPSVGFTGSYVLSLGGNRPAIHVSFERNELLLEGCNTISVRFKMSPIGNSTNGTFKFIDSTILTRRNCTLNIDDQYVDALKTIDGYAKFDKGFYFTTGGTNIIESEGPIEYKRSNTPINPSFIANVSQGSFRFAIVNSSLPSVMTLVGSKGFAIMGCNTVAVVVEIGPNNSFKVINTTNISNNTCKTDNNPQYLEIISNADGYSVLGSTIYLTQGDKKLAEFSDGLGFGFPSGFLPVPFFGLKSRPVFGIQSMGFIANSNRLINRGRK